MSVRYATPDGFAYVVGVYVCGCGRAAEQQGFHAAELPPGWVQLPDDSRGEHLCPECAAGREPG